MVTRIRATMIDMSRKRWKVALNMCAWLRVVPGSFRATATVLGLLLASSASVADAQTIDGKLLDLTTRQPINLGLVLMFTEAGDSVGLAVTDEQGRFRLSSPEPGSFYLLASAFGYRETPAGMFDLGEDAVMEVEYRLPPEPLAINEIVVDLDRPVSAHHLVRNGFVRRLQHGLGHFITPHDIEQSSATSTEGLLANVPNVRVGEVRIAREGTTGEWTVYSRPDIGETVQISGPGGWCTPTVYVDGVRSFYTADMTSYNQVITLSTLASLSAVEAIEVYRRPAEIPVEFSGGSTGTKCGVLVVWTKSGLAAGQRPADAPSPDLADVEEGRLPTLDAPLGEPPSPGERIRFDLDADTEAEVGVSSPWAGTFVALRDESLVATDSVTGRTVDVPVEGVTALQVRRQRSSSHAWVKGALSGAVVGGGTWLGLDFLCRWSDCNSAIEEPWIPAAVTGLFTAFMAYRQGPGDHWVPVVVPEIAGTHDRFGVSVRLSSPR